MNECIICRLEKETMSDEHVIPESLGGYFHIHNVCKSCNSKLGNNIDSPLVNHSFSKFMRFRHKIKGKKSTIPNPFEGKFTFEDSIIRFEINDNGVLDAVLIPKINKSLDADGVITSVEIIHDGSDLPKIQEIVDKISKRSGVEFKKVKDSSSSTRQIEKPQYSGKLEIDTELFKKGIVKIAYEYAVTVLPDYYYTKEAKETSKALYSSDESLIENMDFMGNVVSLEIRKRFDTFLDLSAKKHYLMLFQLDGVGLVCMVFLYDLFSMGVKLTSEKLLTDKNFIIGVNDIQYKEFSYKDATESIKNIYGTMLINFAFLPSDKCELDLLAKQPQFSYYDEKNKIPLFNKYGEKKYNDVSDKISNIQHLMKSETSENGCITLTFNLDESLYLKIRPSNKLYKVLAVQTENNVTNKL